MARPVVAALLLLAGQSVVQGAAVLQPGEFPGLVSYHGETLPQPVTLRGPYEVEIGNFSVPTLDNSKPYVHVSYPKVTGIKRFPILVYMHGAYESSLGTNIFGMMFEQFASWGYVVVAPQSCANPGSPYGATPTQWAFTSRQCIASPPKDIYNCTVCSLEGPQLESFDPAGYQLKCCCDTCHGRHVSQIWAALNWAKSPEAAAMLPINSTAPIALAGHSQGTEAVSFAAETDDILTAGVAAAVMHKVSRGVEPEYVPPKVSRHHASPHPCGPDPWPHIQTHGRTDHPQCAADADGRGVFSGPCLHRCRRSSSRETTRTS